MILSGKNLAVFTLIASTLAGGTAAAQIGVPETAPTAGRDTSTHFAPISLHADLRTRMLTVTRGREVIKTK